nr:MAG TPA: NinG recombination protein [Caudoviricetes sp.]
MNENFYKWLCQLIASGDVHPFYCCTQWVQLSHRVMKMDKYECQICKERGRYRRAELVHHVNHVKDAPDKALDIWYKDADGNDQRNLISVCKDCHETVCHPERLRRYKSKPPLTRERWD